MITELGKAIAGARRMARQQAKVKTRVAGGDYARHRKESTGKKSTPKYKKAVPGDGLGGGEARAEARPDDRAENVPNG